jgi:hypothetical protein
MQFILGVCVCVRTRAYVLRIYFLSYEDVTIE